MKRLKKKCILGALTILMIIGVVALQPPQNVSAGWWDNPITFYNDYGSKNQIVYANGDFYFGGQSKISSGNVNHWLYRTIGYKITVHTKSYVTSIAIPLNGGVVFPVASVDSGGYNYDLNKFTLNDLKFLLGEKNQLACNEFRLYGGDIIVDDYMTVVYNGVVYGGMNENGVPYGEWYDTYDGIANARGWTNPKSLKSYYGNHVKTETPLTYRQRVFVRYQDANGNYGDYELQVNTDYLHSAPFSWSRPADNIYNEASCNYTVTGPNTSYVNVTRKQFDVNLTGDSGIATVTGGGKYYVGQTVNIDATLKPTGVKWKGWEGTGSPFTPAYSFTMPNGNISYKATTNKCSYVLELNGNGNTGGSMADIEVNYDTVLTIPKNAYERTNVPCKFIGWDLNRDSMTASYKDQQSLAIADLINFYKVGNTDARLPIYAIWDEAPNFIITQSPDRYFTLDEAKNGVITEAVLLSTVKAFDKETNPLQKKTKEDILSSGNDVGVTTYNYQASDFTDLNGKAKISIIYKVKDVAGSEGFLGINVFIVDNKPVTVSSNYRSIEGKYLYKGYLDNLKLPIAERKTADQLELLEPEFGGLKLSSYWRTNRASLDKIYNQEIKQLIPERTILIKKETMQRIKDDLLSKQVDYLDINRGTDFKYTKPIGKNYEILEYTKGLATP